MLDIYKEIYELRQKNEDAVLVTVVERKGHGPANVGKKLLLYKNGEVKGTVGGGELEYLAIEKAKEVMKEKKHDIVRYDFTGMNVTKADVSIDMICGGLVTLYYEYIQCSPKIYILGAGHVGMALSDVLADLDYKTVVIEDRKEIADTVDKRHEVVVGDYEEVINGLEITADDYVVVAGYTHEIEYRILKALFKKDCLPKYIGLLASERKARIMLGKLKEEISKDLDFSSVYAPVGLNIGGDTPKEIALSILAEIQSIRYKKESTGHLTKDWR